MFLSFEPWDKVDVDDLGEAFAGRGRLELGLETVQQRRPDFRVLLVHDFSVHVVVHGLFEGGLHDKAPTGNSKLLGNIDKLFPGLNIDMGVVDDDAAVGSVQ